MHQCLSTASRLRRSAWTTGCLLALTGCGSEAALPGASGQGGSSLHGDVTITLPPKEPLRFVQIEAGSAYACARRNDGALYCWGSNAGKAIGSVYSFSDLPIRMDVPRMSTFAAGAGTVCIVAAGEVACWGDNFGFQAGHDGPSTSEPHWVTSIYDAVSVECGGLICCVSTVAGALGCWGNVEIDEYYGSTPLWIDVGEPATIYDIRTPGTVCMILSGNRVSCWGDNYGGLLTSRVLTTPTIVDKLEGAVGIAMGDYHVCMVDELGRPYCLGSNGGGQLGTNGVLESATPLLVEGAEQVVQLSARGPNSCGRTVGGGLVCWGVAVGRNVREPALAGEVEGLENVVDVAAGLYFNCALTNDGEVYCWGSNDSGQMGNGTFGGVQTLPTKVLFPPDAYL